MGRRNVSRVQRHCGQLIEFAQRGVSVALAATDGNAI